MENSHNVNALPPNCLQMVPFEEPSSSLNDIMTRRLKNRERQRRYRARKRHEADLKQAAVVISNDCVNIQPQVKTQVNTASVISNDCVSRIHCRRDWKRDARRAHMAKEQVTPIPTSIPSQVQCLTFGVNVTSSQLPVILDKNEALSSSITPSRRNWKAEARNKKD